MSLLVAQITSAAVDRLDHTAPKHVALGAVSAALALPVMLLLGSLSQMKVWIAAYDLARTTVPQFVAALGQPRPIHIQNLPWKFVEGPYILGPTALTARYHRQDRLVTANALVLSNTSPITVSSVQRDWTTTHTKHVVRFALPIVGQQPPPQAFTVHPGRWTTDFDGDGVADRVAYRDGRWYVLTSSGERRSVGWGTRGDVPLIGRVLDGLTADYIAWRPSNGVWHLRSSRDGTVTRAVPWGMRGDWPMVGDFDGDGRDDLIVYRPSWRAVLGYSLEGRKQQWKLPDTSAKVVGDWQGAGRSAPFATSSPGSPCESMAASAVPVVGDWSGEGHQVCASWTAGLYVHGTGETLVRVPFGAIGDIPVPGDFDGDGRDDYTIWRPSSGLWLSKLSGQRGELLAVPWGREGDMPVGAWPLVSNVW